MKKENVIYELEDKNGCPNCHHQVSLWLGFSGVDNDGVHLAYRCPQCGFETCDYLPDVDDIVPDRIAWRREDDGVITWYSIERAEQLKVSESLKDCPEGHGPLYDDGGLLFCPICKHTESI